MCKSEFALIDTIKSGNTSFLYSLFFKISPQWNIPNGNQRDESWAFVFFLYRSPLEEKHLGKLSAPVGTQFIATPFVAPLSCDCWISPRNRSFRRNQSSLVKKYCIVPTKIHHSLYLLVQMPMVSLENERGIFHLWAKKRRQSLY